MNFKSPEFIRLLKAVSVGAIISIVLFAILNISFAWFLKNREENVGVTIGKVDITTVNANYLVENTGQSIVLTPVKIRNDENVKTLLRASIIFNWIGGYSVEDVVFVLDDSSKWVYNEQDNRYYYKEILYPNGQEGFYVDFLDSIDLSFYDSAFLNEDFTVDVYAEAIQYAGLGYNDVWLEAPVASLNW